MPTPLQLHQVPTAHSAPNTALKPNSCDSFLIKEPIYQPYYEQPEWYSYDSGHPSPLLTH